MKRKWKLVVCLLTAALVLSGCANQPKPEDFPDITQAIGPTLAPTAALQPQQPVSDAYADEPMDDIEDAQSIFASNPYDVDISGLSAADILGEEDLIDPYGFDEPMEPQAMFPQPAGTEYPYAGSTPIPINPVDMPSPTPKPELKFTYSTYSASSVGVTFEGPVGWLVDESQPAMMFFSEPTNQIKDGQQCVITLSAEPVSNNYSKRDLTSHVKARLDTLYNSDYTQWKPSNTANRFMMGAEGVYANYSATTYEGIEIGGRIQYVCINNVLYGLEIVYPLGFRESYLDVFSEIRSSMKQV